MRTITGTSGAHGGAGRRSRCATDEQQQQSDRPEDVTVPAGSNSVSFTVTTVPVTTSASGVVTASFGGVSQSLNLSVRPIRAQTLTLSNTRVRGGTTVNGMVTLECPAVPGAIAVSFTSGNANVAAATVRASRFQPADRRIVQRADQCRDRARRRSPFTPTFLV